MKLTNVRTLIAIFALGLCADVLADDTSALPHLSFVGQGSGGKTVGRDEIVHLVVEGPYLSYDGQAIPSTGVVDYVNQLLKNKGVAYLGVHSRVGTRYGEMVGALDTLRKTNAKDIGVSLVELPVGREI